MIAFSVSTKIRLAMFFLKRSHLIGLLIPCAWKWAYVWCVIWSSRSTYELHL